MLTLLHVALRSSNSYRDCRFWGTNQPAILAVFRKTSLTPWRLCGTMSQKGAEGLFLQGIFWEMLREGPGEDLTRSVENIAKMTNTRPQ